MTAPAGAGEPMILAAEQMAFAARALAQSHPFTPMAKRVVDAAIDAERKAQPGDFSIWAGAALTKGYCVRRVEEDGAGLVLGGVEEDALPDPERLEQVTNEVVTALRSVDGDLDFLIASEAQLMEVLDRVIGSEVGNRLDNAPNNLTSRARAELEDYLTFWVVKGYALRTAELQTGALVATT